MRKMPSESEPVKTDVKVIIHSAESGEIPQSTETIATKPSFDHRLWVIPLILMICAGLLGYAVWGKQWLSPGSVSVIQELGSLVTKHSDPVQGEDKDRVNILLLGIGGEGHDGGTLTDTIMVASIKPSTKQVALISLPRDLIVNIDGSGLKINSAYVYQGMEGSVKHVEDVTGLKIHYYVLVDFSGFRQLIDDVNGVDVQVRNNFFGYYGVKDMATPCPKANLQGLEDGMYCKISFKAGTEHMDGDRALMYSRIRKVPTTSPNYAEENADFGRARRQQDVLQAFKDTVLSAGTVLDPTRITTLSSDLDKHMITNLHLWEMSRLFELVGLVNPDSIINKVVDDTTTKLVESTTVPETGASVVVPVAGTYDYSGIQEMAKKIFKVESQNDTADGNVGTLHAMSLQDNVTIQVLNGTHTAGLASTMAANLEQSGYEISGTGNALTSDYSTTTIYQLNDKIDTSVATTLEDSVQGVLASDRQTETLLSLDDDTLDNSADFIIIVGTDNTNANDSNHSQTN